MLKGGGARGFDSSMEDVQDLKEFIYSVNKYKIIKEDY